jgi:hypothetical protein
MVSSSKGCFLRTCCFLSENMYKELLYLPPKGVFEEMYPLQLAED